MTSKPKYLKTLPSDGHFIVTVRMLEDDDIEEKNVPEDASGKWLFEVLCRQLSIVQEREYFGLRYLEHEFSTPNKRWIDLTKGLLSQLKNTHPRQVSFRIKHYPADPMVDLSLPKSHYLLYHQLRRDLSSGRLVTSNEKLARLAALVVQVELGDYSMQNPLQNASNKSDTDRLYLTNFRVLHNQTDKVEAMICEEHKALDGTLPSEAASELIQMASGLETYGIDPIRVKTKAYGARIIHLGITHQGIAEFVSNRRQKLYPWTSILWMTCDGKQFILATSQSISKKKKPANITIQYKCDNKSVAKALWEWASDRKLFFTLEKSSAVKPVKSKRGLFTRTHTFTFSGRCRREVLGRPTLASSMPTNMGSLTTHSISSSHIQDISSYNQHTMPLSIDAGRSMTAINEDYFQDERIRVTDHDFVPSLPSFGGNSQISAFSEPNEMSKLNCPPSEIDNQSLAVASVADTGTHTVTSHMSKVHSTHLAPLFSKLPKHKYQPEAKQRLRKLLKQQYQDGQIDRICLFDSDEEDDLSESEVAVDALRSAARAGEEWALENDKSTSTSIRSWFSFGRSTSASSSSTSKHLTSTPNRKTTPGSSRHKLPNAHNTVDNSTPVVLPGWRFAALSTGILTGISVIGLALILEAEVHSPLLASIRGHPWMLDFDARYYRPVRSILFGFWRR